MSRMSPLLLLIIAALLQANAGVPGVPSAKHPLHFHKTHHAAHGQAAGGIQAKMLDSIKRMSGALKGVSAIAKGSSRGNQAKLMDSLAKMSGALKDLSTRGNHGDAASQAKVMDDLKKMSGALKGLSTKARASRVGRKKTNQMAHSRPHHHAKALPDDEVAFLQTSARAPGVPSATHTLHLHKTHHAAKTQMKDSIKRMSDTLNAVAAIAKGSKSGDQAKLLDNLTRMGRALKEMSARADHFDAASQAKAMDDLRKMSGALKGLLSKTKAGRGKGN